MCNRDCEHCEHEDCIDDLISEDEVKDSIALDNSISAEFSNELSYRMQYYYKNQEKCKRWGRESYARHREAQHERSRKYYHEHKEHCNELNRRWRAEHKELVKQRQHEYYIRWRDKKRLMEATNGN